MSIPNRYAASSLGHQVSAEAQRLRELSLLQDPATFEVFEQLDIQADWACLDVGAGNGSVAEWLAEKVPDGRVIAADIDTRQLRTGVPRMTPLVHDVVTDEFPPVSFDLVHSRMLLMHLPRPEDTVEKIARWLRPGGYLVIGGFDISIGATSPQPTVARVMEALQRVLREEIGSDLRIERLAPDWLRNAGMVDIHAAYYPAVCGAGQSGQAFLRASLEQVRPAIVSRGWCTHQDFIDLYAWMDQPGSAEIYGIRPVIWGKRPNTR